MKKNLFVITMGIVLVSNASFARVLSVDEAINLTLQNNEDMSNIVIDSSFFILSNFTVLLFLQEHQYYTS